MRVEPERTCVGCRVRGPQRTLIRLVRRDASVRVDPTGAAPGRGAYLHPRSECVEQAVRRGALARALRAAISPSEVSNLLRDIEEAR